MVRTQYRARFGALISFDTLVRGYGHSGTAGELVLVGQMLER